MFELIGSQTNQYIIYYLVSTELKQPTKTKGAIDF